MHNNKPDLVLICNQFPFAFGETFLEIEFPYLYKACNKIIILSRNTYTDRTRELPKDVTVIQKSPKSGFFEKLKTFYSVCLRPKSFIQLLKDEQHSYFNIFEKSAKLQIKRKMVHDAAKAFELKYFIEKHILPQTGSNTLLYSYWQNSAALALALIKKENSSLKCISRAHGGDLYFYVNSNNYQSFRRFLSVNLDKIFFISDFGMKYQSDLLKYKYKSYTVSKLGTQTLKTNRDKTLSTKKTIISCSGLKPIKRVNLIINALAFIENNNINWIHFGDGILKDEIIELAEEKLKDKANVEYDFKGNVRNTEIHRFYSENKVDLFINVSSSEGIPVSIMEALSYGIPVIATDVGGTSEIVDESCGALIAKDSSPQRIAEAIQKELQFNKSESAYQKWDSQYNAEKNYSKFINQITLIDEHR